MQLPACKSAVKGKVVKRERAWLLGGDGNNVWFKEGKRHPTACLVASAAGVWVQEVVVVVVAMKAAKIKEELGSAAACLAVSAPDASMEEARFK